MRSMSELYIRPVCLQDVAGGSNSDATKLQLGIRADAAEYPPDVGGSFWAATTYTQFRDRAIDF